ncbi:MAG: VWA domain-containing protein [Bacteroidales bacterium]|nr:VWA domain-containing protein [Bacteroidales bacterium]
MKKILYLFAMTAAVISCTKSEIDTGSPDKYSGLGLYADGKGGGGEGGGGGDGGQGGDTIQSGQVTAGEWNDLANWDFWNNLGQEEDFSGMADYWSYNLGNRISVNLKNQASQNLSDIKIELLNSENTVIWTARTDNSGNAELFPMLSQTTDYPVESLKIRINGTILEDNIQFYSGGVNSFVLDLTKGSARSADIAFVVDATGSMGDELEYLKVELIDVIGHVKEANPDASIKLGSVFYRDTDDEYLTRVSDFSADINKTIDFIRKQSANGGGDFPEAVHTALGKAINDLQWSSNATSRIIFLVLDAPPHYETQIVDQIHQLIAKAASKGIKVIPVTASGIDKETEFLMRYMSIATNGTYVFITNDSGIGGEHLVPTVGDYDVELLNALLERLINKYLE